MSETPPEKIIAMANAIASILAGHPAELQGAALADCLAIWLAGHHIPGDEDNTHKMRAKLLAEHCLHVRELVPINAKMMGTTA
jgi:hypothetical protein